MSVSGTLGSMLQGISQQPAHIRNDGQITSQVNMVSDVTEGITSRPAAALQAFEDTVPADLLWQNVSVEGENFQIGTRAGEIYILDAFGVRQTVNLVGSTATYIPATKMSSYVFDDEVYLLNRDKVVLAVSDPLAVADVDETSVYATVIQGQYGFVYTLSLYYTDGTVATGTHTVVDGSGASDSNKITGQFIADKVRDDLITDANWKGSSTITVLNGTIHIQDELGMKLTVADGANGINFRVSTSTTEVLEDLPKSATHGSLTKVTGANAADDDFWMRFDNGGETAVGAGFGRDGIWREHFDPNEVSALDVDTMPHVISRAGSVFTIGPGDWQGRRTGDSNTNPLPSFVDRAISDVGGFQSRLVFISGPSAIMSRTNIAVDFFKTSAAAETATDPIDIISTSETEYDLSWIVPFDRDLIVFGSSSQFLIQGTSALTPSNASIVETTNFDTSLGTAPVSTGRTLLFPFQNGGFAGVKEFYSANSVDANEAISITKVQDRYMPGQIIDMVSSTSFSTVLVRVDDPTKSKTVYTYQYFWDGETKAQAAWYELNFPHDVENVFFDGSSIFVLMWDGLRYVQTSVDLDLPADDFADYHITLDLKDYDVTVAEDLTNVTYTSTISGLAFAQGENCAVPGAELTPSQEVDNGDGTYTYWFSAVTAPAGAGIYSGLRYETSFAPTMPFIRDREGKVISQSKLVISDFSIYYVNSGAITTSMKSKYRSTPTVFANTAIPTANNPDDPTGRGVRTGEFTFPWGERSDWSELTISSSDIRPMTIIEIEWFGQVLTRGKRV